MYVHKSQNIALNLVKNGKDGNKREENRQSVLTKTDIKW
jgi:hypothetical protein